MKRVLVLGGPGAGKTERLLRVMMEAVSAGVKPERVAFVGFTRAASNEARERAMKMFGLTSRELPYFRTIHSMAFRQLGLRRSDVIGEEQLEELSDVTGELVGSARDDDHAPAAADRNADPLLTLDHYARATRLGLRAAWEDHGAEIEWFRLKRFSDAYQAYKRDRGLLDFTDMLESYAYGGAPPVPVDVAIVDEVQDLTALQHAVVSRAFTDARELWMAGDDDQSIHAWAGAAEDVLLGMDCEREVLPVSHRLPRAVFDLAGRIVRRVSKRFEKNWRAADRDGSVEWYRNADEVDLSAGSWLLVARTRAQLYPLAELARKQGVAHSVCGRSSVDREHVRAIRAHEAMRAGKRVEADDARCALRAAGARKEVPDGTVTAIEIGYDASPIWHDALVRIPVDDREHYLGILRRGDRLDDAPRVRVETIHGAKGLEAEGVVLSTDMTYRVNRGFELDPDSEHRVFYVGATRASERLCVVAPQGFYGYRL